jgi:superfamily I DNA/RNA helicase
MLTFTNKAAAEMKTRAMGVSLVASNRIDASTFHTFGASLLRSQGRLIGIEPEFDILDDDEAALFGDRGGVERRRRQLPGGMGAFPAPEAPDTPRVLSFADGYEAAKRAEGVVDFDDLLVYSAELLEGNAALAAAYGARFAHVLVDEFQDTNAAQFAIVKALCPHVATVSVFADDDQAIFRFATPRPSTSGACRS